MEEIKFKIPKELKRIVQDSVNVLFQGQIYENLGSSNKKRYEIYKGINVRDTIPFTSVSEEYIKQRGMKDRDKIFFVEYNLNGRKMLDIFKAE